MPFKISLISPHTKPSAFNTTTVIIPCGGALRLLMFNYMSFWPSAFPGFIIPGMTHTSRSAHILPPKRSTVIAYSKYSDTLSLTKPFVSDL